MKHVNELELFDFNNGYSWGNCRSEGGFVWSRIGNDANRDLIISQMSFGRNGNSVSRLKLYHSVEDSLLVAWMKYMHMLEMRYDGIDDMIGLTDSIRVDGRKFEYVEPNQFVVSGFDCDLERFVVGDEKKFVSEHFLLSGAGDEGKRYDIGVENESFVFVDYNVDDRRSSLMGVRFERSDSPHFLNALMVNAARGLGRVGVDSLLSLLGYGSRYLK